MKKTNSFLLMLLAIGFYNSVFATRPTKPESANPHRLNSIKPSHSFRGQTTTWNWDTIYTYDTVGNYQRFTRTYDSKGNMLTNLFETWQNNAWVNYDRAIFTYDANGNRLMELGETWQNNTWKCG